MIIWRGMGILSPIIFIAVYWISYGFFKIFSSPDLSHGWFVYIGAILAGIATWKAGASINSGVYAAQRMSYNQDTIYTHSLFFIPMEIWAIPFTIGVLFYGINNTIEFNKQIVAQNAAIAKHKIDFENKLKLMDSLILHPELGDYYNMRFTGKESKRDREKTYFLPLKVIDFNETQIKLLSTLVAPYKNDLKIYSQEAMINTFSESHPEGFSAWVDKSRLSKAITRIDTAGQIARFPMPTLVPNAALSLSDIWRIDGPVFEKFSGNWTNTKLDLRLRNKGLPATITKIQYLGNKVNWKKDIPTGNVRQNGVDYIDDSTIRVNQKFYLQGGVNDGTNPLIWLFCEDSEGRKFRFDFTREGNDVKIKRNSL